MKTYKQEEGGTFKQGNIGIPNSPDNRHYQKMMEEVSSGKAEIEAFDYAAKDAKDSAIEARVWRDGELSKSDIEIYKLEDSAGSPTQWREYRVALRDWPEDIGFPGVSSRPTKP